MHFLTRSREMDNTGHMLPNETVTDANDREIQKQLPPPLSRYLYHRDHAWEIFASPDTYELTIPLFIANKPVIIVPRPRNMPFWHTCHSGCQGLPDPLRLEKIDPLEPLSPEHLKAATLAFPYAIGFLKLFSGRFVALHRSCTDVEDHHHWSPKTFGGLEVLVCSDYYPKRTRTRSKGEEGPFTKQDMWSIVTTLSHKGKITLPKSPTDLHHGALLQLLSPERLEVHPEDEPKPTLSCAYGTTNGEAFILRSFSGDRWYRRNPEIEIKPTDTFERVLLWRTVDVPTDIREWDGLPVLGSIASHEKSMDAYVGSQKWYFKRHASLGERLDRRLTNCLDLFRTRDKKWDLWPLKQYSYPVYGLSVD
ncbi:hypothetical protein BJ508DRAFT_376103 [Ascobolus immersus RN42]|uniref:Uncharacterized protein n=1 Tax=Ascobolus immersus RN42 TaxID=1160509 RepID=A0A3N4I7B7_ASCIM|nr:hypothetical protein BJ508DRAFT_376103 [Ascobolus immersus RN42]